MKNIIRKIKALKSKTTDNGATESEMASALRKAQKLMQDYAVSEMDIAEEDKDKIVVEEIKPYNTGYVVDTVQVIVRKLFKVRVIQSRHPKKLTFVGFETDVNLAIFFYNNIITNCLAEKNKFLKRDNSSVNGRTLSASFIQGYLSSLYDKVHEMTQENAENGKYGLVIADKAVQVRSKVYELFPNLTKSSTGGTARSRRGYDGGKAASGKYSFRRGMNQAQGNKCLT